MIARRISGTPAGLIAALILALSPFHVRFAQETRMYALLTLNISLATLALTYLLTDPRAAQPIGRQFGNWLRTWRAARKGESAEECVLAQRAHPQRAHPQRAHPQRAHLRPPRSRSTTLNPDRRRQVSATDSDFRTGTGWVTAPTQQRYLPLRTVATDIAWLAYMFFTAASVLTHNTAIFYPIATNLFVLGFIAYRRFVHPPRSSAAVEDLSTPLGMPSPQPLGGPHLRTFAPPPLSNWLLAQVGTFLFWSPWLVAFVVQSMGVYGEFWIPAPTQETVVNTLKALLNDFLPERIAWDHLLWTGYSALLVLGVIHLCKRLSILVFLLVLVLTPMAGELLVSLRRPIFYDRTLIWTTIPLYVLLALGFVQLRFKPYIIAGLIMLSTINLLSLQNYYDNFEKEQWREAAAYVAKEVQNDDLILFNATWVQIPFDYYFRYFNRPVERRGAPVDLFDRGILEPKMAESDLPRLRSLLRNRERVWLIYSHDWYTDPQRLIPAALDEELDLVDSQQFYGLQVQRYEVP